MALSLRPNDNAREGRPSVWIFSGQSVVLFVIGFGLSLGLFRVANALWGLETVPSLIVGIIPLGFITAFVAFFVNGKPESYALDLALLGRVPAAILAVCHRDHRSAAGILGSGQSTAASNRV